MWFFLFCFFYNFPINFLKLPCLSPSRVNVFMMSFFSSEFLLDLAFAGHDPEKVKILKLSHFFFVFIGKKYNEEDAGSMTDKSLETIERHTNGLTVTSSAELGCVYGKW